ncbi:MAG TPA: IucA/IucC family protein [Pantanalinema sp.]
MIGRLVPHDCLSADEARLLDALGACAPELRAAYLAALPKARKRTLLRLAAALVREGLPGVAELSLPISGRHAFGRAALDERLAERYPDAGGLLEAAAARGHAPDLAWGSFARELDNASANQALAYAHWEGRKKQIRAASFGACDALGYALARKAADPHFSASLFFEQLCVEGHNLHPGAKTKLDMAPGDVLRYSPEFEGAPELRLVAIRREHAEWASLDGATPDVLLFNAHPELARSAGRELEAMGLGLDEVVLVPVHPWQAAHALEAIYGDDLKAGRLFLLAQARIPARATTSFRTVVPPAHPGAFALKVAVNSQMTSTVRSISVQSTQNAPRVTRLIRAIIDREPTLRETFVPVCEVAGVSFRPDPQEADPARRALKLRNLSAIWREDVEALVRPGEIAVSGSALYAESPLSAAPVLVEILRAFAASSGERSLTRAAIDFLGQYASICLGGYLTFMVRYGIGLEGHLQNSVPVFDQGAKPVRMLFRDWGGVRVYPPRLARHGLKAELYPDSVTVARDAREMQNKVFNTVYQNHLAEIVLLLCAHAGVAEERLWRRVHDVTERILVALERNREDVPAVQEDRAALYRPVVAHKALATMRLRPDHPGYCYVDVPNPLAAFDR